MKGRTRLSLHIRAGVPHPTIEADRVIRNDGPRFITPEGTDFIMDLAADMQVPLSVEYTDEMGNPATAPDGATVVYSVDRPDLIALTDNGDGTGNAAAVGPLGIANVHVDATVGDTVLAGDLQIVVVAGLAERLSVVAGEPTEVTPDIPPVV